MKERLNKTLKLKDTNGPFYDFATIVEHTKKQVEDFNKTFGTNVSIHIVTDSQNVTDFQNVMKQEKTEPKGETI